jgi:hypothetical protein
VTNTSRVQTWAVEEATPQGCRGRGGNHGLKTAQSLLRVQHSLVGCRHARELQTLRHISKGFIFLGGSVSGLRSIALPRQAMRPGPNRHAPRVNSRPSSFERNSATAWMTRLLNPQNGQKTVRSSSSSLDTLQPTQHLLPNTTLSNNHLDSLRNNTPAHSTPRSPPHASALILLPRSQNLGSTSSSSRASSRVNITRNASGRQARRGIDGAHGDDFQAAGVCRGGGGLRGGDCEDGFGHGKLVAGWVEEDVGADGGYEEGYWWSGLVLSW